MYPPAKIHSIIAVALAALISAPPTADAKILDKIVAVVNEEVITQSEIDNMLYPLYLQYSQIYKTEKEVLERLDRTRLDILKQLINDKLVLTEAKRLEIRVEESAVDERVKMIRDELAANGKDLAELLSEQNISMGDLRKRHREQLMIERTIEREVRSKISIQPSEVLSYYKENIEDYTQSEQVAIYTILIKFDSIRTRGESRQLVEDIRAMIVGGKDFREVAVNYTEGPNKDAGGDMGFVERGQLLKEIDDVIFSLKTGELSPIIESPIGYHLCQVYDRKDKNVVQFDDVMDQVRMALYRAKAEKEFEDWLDNLKTNAYISIK